jgi:WD40 repeat protein/tRNA A-37 threonylcarbamoyl transferase component Bud32
MIYGSDSTINQYDLDTGDLVRNIKPSRSAVATAGCAYDAVHETVFCCLSTGTVRKINMVTGRIEKEFLAHDGTCDATVNDTYVYTGGIDGSAKRFDLDGNLLNEYKASLGYVVIEGFENDYLFTAHLNTEGDEMVRILRWNTDTETYEEFPRTISHLLGPATVSKDYYFAVETSLDGIFYSQFIKSNLSLVRGNSVGSKRDYFKEFFVSGERCFIISLFKLLELKISDDGLIVGEGFDIPDYTAANSEIVMLNETIMLVSVSGRTFENYYTYLLDLKSGIYYKNLGKFDNHRQFQVSGNLLVAAVGRRVAAYNLNDLELAWMSPPLTSQNVFYMRYQDGYIYIKTANFFGYYDAVTFQEIAAVTAVAFLNGVPAFLNEVFYANFGWNRVTEFNMTDAGVVKEYTGSTNELSYILIYQNHLFAGSLDKNSYKFEIDSAKLTATFTGHSDAVSWLTMRGQFMYSASFDFTIRKWNIDTAEQLFIYFGHTTPIFVMYLSGNRLFSMGQVDIRSWDLTRDRLLTTYFDRSSVLLTLFTIDNSLVSCSVDGTVSLWNVVIGLKVKDIVEKADDNYVIATKGLKDTLAILKSDGSLLFISLEDNLSPSIETIHAVRNPLAFTIQGDMIFAFGEGEGIVKKNRTSNSVSIASVSRYISNALLVVDDYLFSGNNDSSITKFSALTMELIASIAAHAGPVRVLGRRGNQLISGSNDNSLKTWNVQDMNLIFNLRRDSSVLGHVGPITAVFVQGDTLFSGSEDTTVKKWDLSTGKLAFTYLGHSKKITSVYYSNGSLFTTAEDELIQVFNVFVASPISTSRSGASPTLTRINPPNSRNSQESAPGFNSLLVIVSVASVILVIAFVFSCRWLSINVSKEPSTPYAIKDSAGETSNTSVLQDMTLAPTSMGISVPASKEVTERDFILMGKLGKGGAGEVFYAKPISKNLSMYGSTIVAKNMSKRYTEMNSNEKSIFDQEIGIMEMLKGRGCFVELLGYSLNPCVILMKIYPIGSLNAWIQNTESSLPNNVIISFLNDISRGIFIMHKLQLAHCDLKPDNILLEEQSPGYFKCVLTDFGITQILSTSIIDAKAFNSVNVRGLSVRYAAPEAFLRFRKKILAARAADIMAGDIYSLMCVLYEMLVKISPWT